MRIIAELNNLNLYFHSRIIFFSCTCLFLLKKLDIWLLAIICLYWSSQLKSPSLRIGILTRIDNHLCFFWFFQYWQTVTFCFQLFLVPFFSFFFFVLLKYYVYYHTLTVPLLITSFFYVFFSFNLGRRKKVRCCGHLFFSGDHLNKAGCVC